MVLGPTQALFVEDPLVAAQQLVEQRGAVCPPQVRVALPSRKVVVMAWLARAAQRSANPDAKAPILPPR